MRFNEHMNILVGENEAGKSTILDALKTVMNQQYRNADTSVLRDLFNTKMVATFKENPRIITLPRIYIEVELALDPQQKNTSYFYGEVYGQRKQQVEKYGIRFECQYDEEVSTAIVDAICEVDKDLIVYYCAGAVLGQIAESRGLRTASEIFADRAYMDDLSLVPRKMEGSMITDENIAIERCVRMIKEGKVTSINGKELDIKGDTLCVHGDGPKALAFVQKIRERFTQEGIEIKHL